MTPEKPETVGSMRAVLIGDVVGSRRTRDRQELHATLARVLEDANAARAPLDPLRITVGDEFQGGFTTLGSALALGQVVRLALLVLGVDVRLGLGWGMVEVLDARAGTQDGPGWWAAREAIETTKALQSQAGTRHVRTSYQPAVDDPREPAVTAALLCRDHMVGSLDDRSIRILRELMADRTQLDIAEAEGISASAVSQRIRRHGLDVLVTAQTRLEALT